MAQTHKLRFRICKAPRNEIYKKPYMAKKKHTVSCTMKEGTSIAHPHFIVNFFEDFYAYNYCYSYDFHRDYFIDDIITLPQGMLEIVCSVDVLYSFRDAIGNLTVQEERATDGQSNLLEDREVPVMHNTIIDKVIKLPVDEFNTESFPIIRAFTNNTYKNLNSGSFGADYSDNESNIGHNVNSSNKTPMSLESYNFAYGTADKAYQYWKTYENSVLKTMKEFSRDRKYQTAFPLNYVYTQDDEESYSGKYKNAWWCDDENGQYGWYTRHDTMFADEANEVSDLTYTNNGNISGRTLPMWVQGCNWNGWDCSQFAWRCVRFNTGNSQTKISIGDISNPNNCGDDYTAGIVKVLGNYQSLSYVVNSEDGTPTNWHGNVDVTKYINSVEDLLEGDIVISGKLTLGKDDTIPSYWVCMARLADEGYKWFVVNKKDADPIVDSSAYVINNTVYDNLLKEVHNQDSNVRTLEYIQLVNHAKVYVGNKTFIEVCYPNLSKTREGNLVTALGSASPNSTNKGQYEYAWTHRVIQKNTIGSLKVETVSPTSATSSVISGYVYPRGTNNMRVVYIDGRPCRIYRPCLLLNNGLTLNYDQWHRE